MQYPKFCFTLGTIIISCSLQVNAVAQTSGSYLCDPLLLRDKSATDSNGVYFLPQTFSGFVIEWYSKHLSAMKEPVLHSRNNCKVESYRFLWLRTFDPPIAIRLWQAGDQRFLVVKRLNGKGGYEPGTLVINRMRPMTEKEWNTFRGYLDQISYWDIPTEEKPVVNADGTINVIDDGAQWILEGVKENRYHIVDIQSAKGKYRESCLYLLKLSGLKINKEDIY